MESSRRALSNGMTVCGPIWKNSDNTMVPFYFHPKMGVGVPQTGIIFVSVWVSLS